MFRIFLCQGKEFVKAHFFLVFIALYSYQFFSLLSEKSCLIHRFHCTIENMANLPIPYKARSSFSKGYKSSQAAESVRFRFLLQSSLISRTIEEQRVSQRKRRVSFLSESEKDSVQ
jgi:hypothetical protein